MTETSPARVAPVKRAKPRRAPVSRTPAADRPIARVSVDVPLPHLDRPFDYLVPEELADSANPGCRVRVRFAGQLVDGFVLDRVDESDHSGRLTYLDRVVSAESVLHPDVAALARDIADRYAGTLADVLRLAVPPRHARVESAPPPAAAPQAIEDRDHGWYQYPAGDAFLRALREGRMPRAVWTALPGEDWPARYADAVAATLAAGRGALAVVADARDLDRLDAALTSRLGKGWHVALSAALGPAERYRRFLAASRGSVRVVIGTRAAVFAPVSDLGFVAIWDDGDDLHAEPRAPYPHARQVLLARAELAGGAALLGGYARSAEAQQLVEAGWAREVVADREMVRQRAPHVVPVGDDGQLARDPAAASARLPSVAWQAARAALATGAPVLVQVPRRGYLPSVSCGQCGSPARCASCAGPLALPSASAPPACRWCGRPAAGYSCVHCGGRRLRAAVTGARRTAEELARAFPDTPVRTSGRDGVLATVGAEAALVVATPGAEPVAVGGYGAVLLLDTWALLTRADLRAAEEALRRWLAAAALARPGGTVVVVADGGLAPVQALLRFDPGWLAARELAERRELRFPPAARVASLTGTPEAIEELQAVAALPAGAEVLGPVPAGRGREASSEPARSATGAGRGREASSEPAGSYDQERLLIRTSRANGRALAAALKAAAGVRSAKKSPNTVRIQIDPQDLL